MVLLETLIPIAISLAFVRERKRFRWVAAMAFCFILVDWIAWFITGNPLSSTRFPCSGGALLPLCHCLDTAAYPDPEIGDGKYFTWRDFRLFPLGQPLGLLLHADRTPQSPLLLQRPQHRPLLPEFRRAYQRWLRRRDRSDCRRSLRRDPGISYWRALCGRAGRSVGGDAHLPARGVNGTGRLVQAEKHREKTVLHEKGWTLFSEPNKSPAGMLRRINSSHKSARGSSTRSNRGRPRQEKARRSRIAA